MDFNKMEKEKIIGVLESFIDRLIDDRNRFRDRLREYDKDEEIAKLIKDRDNLLINSIHILSPSEIEQANEFKDMHLNKCKGNTRYITEGTGIGVSVKIQCTVCDTEKDITDVSSW